MSHASRTHSLYQRLLTHPEFTLIALGLTVGLCLSALFSLYLQKRIDQHTQNYGQAIARMAANQAIDASFNHDLVRLHVILRDTVENPHTVFATLHDVENNLLVQAGDSRHSSKHIHRFTAPIILHDSVAGYITIATRPDNPARSWIVPLTLSLIAVLTLALVASVYGRYRSTGLRLTDTQHTPHATQNRLQDSPGHSSTPYSQPEYDPLATTHSVTTAPVETPNSVFTLIYIKNLSVLKQQLNGSSYRHTLTKVENILQDILALYSGTDYVLEDNRYTLRFSITDTSQEALFRAICGGYLALELASIINNIPLDLAGVVTQNEENIVHTPPTFTGLMLEDDVADNTSVQQRMTLMATGTDGGQKVVARFEEPFKGLIEKQRQQLAQAIEHH